MSQLVFLKLGGSLITDKHLPHTANVERIRLLAQEIQQTRQTDPDLQLLLGHGSGSFGHVPASKYHTRKGVHTAEEWQGFAEVWAEASTLNRIVMDLLIAAGLPVISLPASSSLVSANGQVDTWNIIPISSALEHRLVPVVFGDVVFDRVMGGTIFSTEQLFEYLARMLRPDRILIAGSEQGVWSDFPECTQLIQEITPAEYSRLSKLIFSSNAVDVTGGMAGKVESMVGLVKEMPHLQITIFNPTPVGALSSALRGEPIGTLIHN